MANTPLPMISPFRPGVVAETILATRIIIRESRDLMARTDELLTSVILTSPDITLDYSALAHRYSDWAREQVAFVDKATNHKDRREHVALAQRYLCLAEEELLASTRESSKKKGAAT
jgi:hypothetical protein